LETRQWKETAALSELHALHTVGTDYIYSNNLPQMRLRLQSDTARAMDRLDRNRARSLELLEQCHVLYVSDGSLADFFFPALREVGLIEQHDLWFKDSWNQFETVIRRFPKADNVRNTAAWFASRAVRELEAAEKHVRVALELRPRQSAFLDTLAEIYFARGQRSRALNLSNQAINYMPSDLMIRRQHERFRSAPFPK
jgi:tetratricopeptide (TPR) repeat protein